MVLTFLHLGFTHLSLAGPEQVCWGQVRAVMGTTLSTPKDAPLPPILMQQETDSVWSQPGKRVGRQGLGMLWTGAWESACPARPFGVPLLLVNLQRRPSWADHPEARGAHPHREQLAGTQPQSQLQQRIGPGNLPSPADCHCRPERAHFLQN